MNVSIFVSPPISDFSMSMITAGDYIPADPCFIFPPPPPPPLKSSMPMLYYGLAVVGTAAILLAIYNLIIIKCCSERPDGRAEGRSPAQAASRSVEVVTSGGGGGGGGRRQGNQMNRKVSSFKYKKEKKLGCEEEEGSCCREQECSVCLSDFEEGEEVRQLPRCNHSFHAPCIDMWLYSHSDCPLCRARVEPPTPPPPSLLCQGHTAVVVEGRAVS